MMTDNENWRNGSDENQESANGYNRSFNRENRFNSYNNYNREEGGQRPFRPNGYGNRMNGGIGNRTDRPQRPRFTRSSENAAGEERPRFTRVNGNNEGGYAPRYSRPQRPYDNHRQEGGEGRPVPVSTMARSVLGVAMLVVVMDKSVSCAVPVDSTMAVAVLKEECVSAQADIIPMLSTARRNRLSTKRFWLIRTNQSA